MSTYRLEKMFAPRSVAVIGIGRHEGSPARAALRNLRRGGFAGRIHLIDPHGEAIEGVGAIKSHDELPEPVDLLVIGAPPATVPALIAAAGAKGTPAAIILTAGSGRGPGSLAELCERTARATGMRLLGPNCLGVLVPDVKLNASFAASMPQPGDLALVSQSGAIAAGLMEWASACNVGFSAVVSTGDGIDVDVADLLDFLALDRATRAIFLCIEQIKDARKFMSAARAAARVKPVLVVKSGRHVQRCQPAATHAGALAGPDAVYDAAFRRAGLLRVRDLDELFAAAQTLGRLPVLAGKRLTILTNGGGGALAVDRLADLGGELAGLSPATMQRLDAALPPVWSRANPVDIAGDADAARYAAALECLLEDAANDAILVINAPTALATAADAATSVAAVTQRHRHAGLPVKPVLAAWIGGDPAITGAAAAFAAAAIPSYATETDAVSGFMHLVQYRELRDLLMATPPSMPQHIAPDSAAVRPIIEQALERVGEKREPVFRPDARQYKSLERDDDAKINHPARGDRRAWLDPWEITRLFSAYDIPIAAAAPAAPARGPEEAAAAARPHLAAGNPVVIKIVSPDIVHKSEVGGVRLNLASEEAVRQATAEMLNRARAAKPDARIAGVAVFPMIVRPAARELIVGVADDPTFGPVIVFGQGGTAVEVVGDKAMTLPPLDLALARRLIARTRVARILKAYRNVPAADERALELLLVNLAQLVADFPEIREIDLNPVLADDAGVIVVGARVSLAATEKSRRGPAGHPRFAIRPYPTEWERHVRLKDGGTLLVRPVKPEDEPLYGPFLAAVTAEDLRLRFFAPVKDFSHAFIARFTQIDYARAMAFLAIDEASGDMLGVVRLHADANYDCGEYAILLRSDCKGRGLGWQLMQLIIDYARAEGIRLIRGQVLQENTTMLEMCRELGFRIAPDPEEPSVFTVDLPLTAGR